MDNKRLAETESIDVFSVTPNQWEELFRAWGEKPIHVKTLLRALYRDRVTAVESIEGMPKSLVAKLTEAVRIRKPSIRQIQESVDGTKKFLFEMDDGDCVEGVLLRYEHGNTLCLSTQRGCRMGCAFCASTGLAFGGGLTAGEIVGQWLAVEERERVSVRNLVYMGIGEPLDNADAVKDSLEIFTDQRAVGMAPRHISVSTCGVVPGILRMAKEKWPCRLAVSLHHADDELRGRFMPVNRRWPVDELLEACRTYAEETGYIVFFEYALLPGVNDRPQDAERLVSRLRGIPSRVNLIRLNPLDAAAPPPDLEAEEAFRAVLREAGFVTTLRPALGQDIDGACGQLRRKQSKEEPNAGLD